MGIEVIMRQMNCERLAAKAWQNSVYSRFFHRGWT